MMIGRLDFLKASAGAMVGLSVRDLTDGHDEYLWQRENREWPVGDIAVRVLGRDGLVLAERDAVATIVDHAWYAPELDRLRYTNTSRRAVAVERIVVVFDPFGYGEVTNTMAAPGLPIELGAGESITVLPHQPLLELTFS